MTPVLPKRYYHYWAKKYMGQMNGADFTLYETGHEMWLTDEEHVLMLLKGAHLIEADRADVDRQKYVDWLSNARVKDKDYIPVDWS